MLALTSRPGPRGEAPGLSRRLSLLRRRRQSRLLRAAIRTVAWLVASLVGLGCVLGTGALLTWAA